MMGMASHLIAQNKVNYEFLENYTTGFDNLKIILMERRRYQKMLNGQAKFVVSMKR